MNEETVPKRQYTEEFRLEAVRLADSVGGHEAAQRLGIPIATLSSWHRRRRKALGKETIESAPGGHARRSQGTGQCQGKRGNPPKGDAILREGVAVKYAWIDVQRDYYRMTRLCRVLAVSRTGYCQWRGRAPSARTRTNAVLDVHVRQIHVGSRASYGRPRIV